MWFEFSPVACSICFGNASGPLIDAARLGVLIMVAVTVCVLAAFAAFFLRLAHGAGERLSPAAHPFHRRRFSVRRARRLLPSSPAR